MLKTIIRREMLEYIKSPKFLIGLSVAVVLIGISTVINMADYAQRRQDYLDARQNAEDSFRKEVFREPQPLSVLVQGKDRKLGTQMQFTYMNIPVRTSGYMGFYSQHNNFYAGFDSVDYAFVVRVVLSLLVIFFAYNTVSEEKMRGTLKLSLANNLPRDQLLLGKLLGGLLVIFGSLLFATLLALLFFLVHPAIVVTGSLLLRITAMLLISMLYLLWFYMLTLFVSVLINRPATALMILLQIWIFLIIIYPNVSVILAQKLTKLPSREELAARKAASTQSIESEYQHIREAFYEMVYSGKSDRDLQVRNVEINARKTELEYNVDNEYSKKLANQKNVAEAIAILSPAVHYNAAMTRFAKTDIQEFELFMQGVKLAWDRYIELFKLRYTDIEAFREQRGKQTEFTYNSESVGESAISTMTHWLVLLFMSIIFFMLAYVAFLRKDVR